MTKNDEERIAYLTPELKAALTERLERVKALELRLGRIVPWVFAHRDKGKRAGQPRRDLRKAWTGACKKAGVPGRYRHDFRRTAVRNMERLGVPRSVATKITAQDRIRLPTLRDCIGCRLAGGGAAYDSHKKATIRGFDAAAAIVSVRQSKHGRIAQVEEHGPYKAGVAGSSPAPPTIKKRMLTLVPI
jgi:integrase